MKQKRKIFDSVPSFKDQSDSVIYWSLNEGTESFVYIYRVIQINKITRKRNMELFYTYTLCFYLIQNYNSIPDIKINNSV